MDINEYISSGIIENYVLGSVSKQERKEVECMSHIYPEIKTALSGLQENIEKLALKVAINPPASLRAKIMAQIKTEPQEKSDSSQVSTSTKVIPITKSTGSRMYKLMSAASIILLLGVGFYAYKVSSDLGTAKNDVAVSDQALQNLQADYAELNGSNRDMSNELATLSDQMGFIRDQNTSKVNLAGTADYADNLATVFWNKESQKVMLDVQNLPTTSSEESYQLWVLVDGQPIDMGVFDFDLSADAIGLLDMKTTGEADAFAITREPKGGSVSPTLEQLHVIGTI